MDFADLVVLARNYGLKNAGWGDGDFNGDGTVGFDDLVSLAGNYGQSLPAVSATDAPATAHVSQATLSPMGHRRHR